MGGFSWDGLFNSADVYESSEEFDWRKLSKAWGPVYTAYSDQTGKAVVSNIPAFPQWVTVSHTNFEMAIEPKNNSREQWVKLAPDEVTRVTVRLQKKGTDHLQSPQ